MLPAITPPTDNLYKFISLFGLTIFLFAGYNLGIVYDQSSAYKMQISDISVDVNQLMFKETKLINAEIATAPPESRLEKLKVRKKLLKSLTLGNLYAELNNVEKAISKSKLDEALTIPLNGKVSKLKIALDDLRIKLWTYVFFVGVGIAVMLFGFLRWKKKEQDLRDQILNIEHAIKVMERENKTNKKKKKVKIIEPAVIFEKMQVNEQMDQN